MIQYLGHNAIDFAKWDATIATCGNVYAYSWYLDIVHPQWEALVEDDYQAVMPLTGGKKFGVHYLFQPYFAQQLGVFSLAPLSQEKVRSFLEAIPEKYRFAEFRLNESNTLDNNVQKFEYHRNVILDLNHNYDGLRANYHTNTKRNLAKAEAGSLRWVEGVNPEQVVALFVANRGASLDKWGKSEYDRLVALTQAAVQREAAFVAGVTENDDASLLCAAIFMKANNRITFLFSGQSEAGKKKQAMTFLIDHVIRKYASQPLTFDFEGSDDENLARFYLGFGGIEVSYPSYAFNRLSSFGKSLLKAWKRLK